MSETKTYSQEESNEMITNSVNDIRDIYDLLGIAITGAIDFVLGVVTTI